MKRRPIWPLFFATILCHYLDMKFAKGNALFLILIAVALFAALSYAVTQSGRGGSGIDREQADILAAQIMNQVAAIQAQIQRLEIIGNYDQVHMTDTAANDSGTCFSGKNTTPCRTIGLLSDEVGMNLFWDDRIRDSSSSATIRWMMQSLNYQIDGTPVGSSAPDTIILLIDLSDELCAAINRKVSNTSDIGTFTQVADTTNGVGTLGWITDDGTIANAAAESHDLTSNFTAPGCALHTNGYNYAIFPIDIN